MKIAVDVMGGDHAPAEVLAGCARAVREGYVRAEELVLVGDSARIGSGLAAAGVPSGTEIVHASEAIEMHEHPAQALRKKRDSSIVVGARLLKERRVQAFVSAGNTGAMVGAATLLVRTLEGVRRPGIAVTFTSAKGPCCLIDCGANIHCQPEDLFTYGLMASHFMTGVHGVERPSIGLLNIGEEEEKGNPLVLRTREMFEQSDLNFIGNVEGQDVFAGRCDVIVCEGFVGNVVLKVSEGLGQFITNLFAHEVKRLVPESALPSFLNVAGSVKKKTDYAEYGGAPLLGVDGLTIICHGRSDARAIANALHVSHQFIEHDVNRHILEGLSKLAAKSPPSAAPAPNASSSPHSPRTGAQEGTTA